MKCNGGITQSGRATDRPNILLIITDQQSADTLSCRIGHEYISTPAMDSLAARGTLFTRAYTSNPLCMPARNSLFTGRYPHEIDVTSNKPVHLAPEFVSMGTYFRDAGYKTAYSGKWHLCYDIKDRGTHGFDILKLPAKPYSYDARVARAATDFLRKEHGQPFLLVVSLLNPHNICQWPLRVVGRKQTLSCGEIGTPPSLDKLPPVPANLNASEDEPDGLTFLRHAYPRERAIFTRFTPEHWRKHRWGYYRMVEKVDGQIAKILNALRDTGNNKDTLIIFTSDHGDCLGAHRFNVKKVFYEEATRIPLIICWGGKTLPTTSDKLANIGIDVLPTIMEAAGIKQPSSLPGRSLLPVAMGGSSGPWRRYVVSQNHFAQSGSVDVNTIDPPTCIRVLKPVLQGRMVRTDQYKYCVYSHGNRREALYDLQSDPLEITNLATNSKYDHILVEHRKYLAKYATKYNDVLVRELLANNVGPRPFVVCLEQPSTTKLQRKSAG